MAVYYADSAGAQGTGDGSTALNACTLKQFWENDVILYQSVVAGDDCYCKNGTTIIYDGSAGFFATITVEGTALSPIRAIGYSTVITDGGIVEIEDSDSGATTRTYNTQNYDYIHMYNYKIINARGFDLLDVDGWLMYNVEMLDPLFRGFDINNGNSAVNTFINCIVDGSTGAGYDLSTRSLRMVNCIARNCSGNGFTVGNINYGAQLVGCLSYSNGGLGFSLTGESLLDNCIADDNTGDGIYIDADSNTQIINCGITNNGGYGLNGDSGSLVFLLNCGFDQNTSGNINTGNITELYNYLPQTTDPLYTNQGAGDYTLQPSSPWTDAGAGYNG